MNRILTLAALLLLATPAWSADGDLLASFKGNGVAVDIFKLCDGATGGATKQCATFDLQAAHAGVKGGSRPPVPDIVDFSFNLASGCAGATTIMPQGSHESDADPRTDLDSAPIAKPATSEVSTVRYGDRSFAHRYVTADIQVGTSCTDAELWMTLIYFTD